MFWKQKAADLQAGQKLFAEVVMQPATEEMYSKITRDGVAVVLIEAPASCVELFIADASPTMTTQGHPARATRYSLRTISINSSTDVSLASFSYVIRPRCIRMIRSAISSVCA